MNRRKNLETIEKALDNIPFAEQMIGKEENAVEFRLKELYTAVRGLANDLSEEIELQERGV